MRNAAVLPWRVGRNVPNIYGSKDCRYRPTSHRLRSDTRRQRQMRITPDRRTNLNTNPRPPGSEPSSSFLGLFGLIPAAMKSSRAEALGYPTTPYWKAFWLTLLLPVVFLLILVLASS